jgi:hypothetical protein
MNRRSTLGGIVLLAVGMVLGAAGILLWHHVQDWSGGQGSGPPRMYEATIYLPLHDNQGVEFHQDEWQAAIEILVKEFGGATLGAKQEGFWENGQHIQREPVQLLTITFERSQLGRFREKVREVGRRLGQGSVYVRFEEPRIDLIECPAGAEKKER